MSNGKSIEIDDPTIADLAVYWDDRDLIDMYGRMRNVLRDRNEWSVGVIVTAQETLGDVVAELRRRGHDWMTVA